MRNCLIDEENKVYGMDGSITHLSAEMVEFNHLKIAGAFYKVVGGSQFPGLFKASKITRGFDDFDLQEQCEEYYSGY